MDKIENIFSPGFIVAAVVGYMLYVAKGIPGTMWKFLKWQFTSTLMLYSDDGLFPRFMKWLNQQEGIEKDGHLKIDATYDRWLRDYKTQYSIGEGWHRIGYNGKMIFIHREQHKGGVSERRRETIRLVVLGRNSSLLQSMMDDIIKTASDKGKTEIYMVTQFGTWAPLASRVKRRLETVVLPVDQKQRIMDGITQFVGSEDYYKSHGLPYKLGMLFHGPPGTGKTSLVLALAGELNRPVYALNLGVLNGDDDLIESLIAIPSNALILIEDLHAQKTVSDRVSDSREKGARGGRVSMGTVLNILDGVLTKHGQLICLTSNSVGLLDAAILRPGRVDFMEYISEMAESEAHVLCKQFDVSWQHLGVTAPISGATLVQRILEMRLQDSRDWGGALDGRE